jgi:hypothetical protein
MKNYLEHTEDEEVFRLRMNCILNRGMDIAHVISNVNDLDELEERIPETIGKIKQCQKTNIINSTHRDIFELDQYQRDIGWLDKLLISREGIRQLIVWKDMSWPLSEHFDFLVQNLVDDNEDMLCAGFKEGDYTWKKNHPVIINLEGLRQKLDDDVNNGILVHFRHLFVNEDYSWLDALIMLSDILDMQLIELDDKFRNELVVLDDEYDNAELDFFDKMMKITDIVDSEMSLDDVNNLRSNADDMDEFYQNFYGLKLLKFQLMYVTNTEFVPSRLITKNKFNTLIMPCSGLNQILKFLEHSESVERIVHFDFSPISVRWTKHVIENWDGTNFIDWYQDNKHVILEDGIMREENIIFEEEQIESLENLLAEHKIDPVEMMNKIRSIKNDFILLDVSKEPMKFIETLGDDTGKNIYLNITNIFQYESTYLNNDPFDAQLAFLNIVKSLTKENRLWLSGDTPGGKNFHEEFINSKTCIF